MKAALDRLEAGARPWIARVSSKGDARWRLGVLLLRRTSPSLPAVRSRAEATALIRRLCWQAGLAPDQGKVRAPAARKRLQALPERLADVTADFPTIDPEVKAGNPTITPEVKVGNPAFTHERRSGLTPPEGRVSDLELDSGKKNTARDAIAPAPAAARGGDPPDVVREGPHSPSDAEVAQLAALAEALFPGTQVAAGYRTLRRRHSTAAWKFALQESERLKPGLTTVDYVAAVAANNPAARRRPARRRSRTTTRRRTPGPWSSPSSSGSGGPTRRPWPPRPPRGGPPAPSGRGPPTRRRGPSSPGSAAATPGRTDVDNGRLEPRGGGNEARVPPQNLEAEVGVLGSVLLDNATLDDVEPLLAPGDFYRGNHQVLFGVIRELHAGGVAVDGITLADELARRGLLDGVGGGEAIADILGGVPTEANAKYYAQIVREKSKLRTLIEVATGILRKAYGGDHTGDDLLREAEAELFTLAARGSRDDTAPVGASIDAALEALTTRRDRVSGLTTGKLDLDYTIDGLTAESLLVVAARPSMGKTAFALHLATHVACALRKGVLYVSGEMNQKALSMRSMVCLSGIPAKAFGEIERWDARRGADFTNALAALRDAPLYFDDTPNRTIAEVCSNARTRVRRDGVSLLVVDYLQQMETEAGRDSRQEQIAKMSRRLKNLARELRIPVVALSQLNRGVENREDKRPRMADLRESGAIEQDADVVMLLHRPSYYDPEDQPGQAEVIVAKNRNGETKSIRMRWHPETQRFDEDGGGLGDVPEF